MLRVLTNNSPPLISLDLGLRLRTVHVAHVIGVSTASIKGYVLHVHAYRSDCNSRVTQHDNYVCRRFV